MSDKVNTPGLEAINRAYIVMGFAQTLVSEVKNAIHSPSWKMAKALLDLEQQLGHVKEDMDALEALYNAMASRGQQ